jgi:hypothetical protein
MTFPVAESVCHQRVGAVGVGTMIAKLHTMSTGYEHLYCSVQHLVPAGHPSLAILMNSLNPP